VPSFLEKTRLIHNEYAASVTQRSYREITHAFKQRVC
jgi:hypothetical protein